jgi:hypothetical protein
MVARFLGVAALYVAIALFAAPAVYQAVKAWGNDGRGPWVTSVQYGGSIR